MNAEQAQDAGPDFGQGIAQTALGDGVLLLGHVGGEAVLLARHQNEFFAISATCTHYGAPLAEGLLVDDTVRCPWHHACFSLRSGAALRAPALESVSCWEVEERDELIFVREKKTIVRSRVAKTANHVPRSVVIVGGGAAGNAAAETLRNEGYEGRVTLLSADEFLPCDRPNLSKGYLAGSASEGSNLLRSAQFYRDREIDVHLGTRVNVVDVGRALVGATDGSHYAYDALLLATGAEPVRLACSGSSLPHVCYLRTLADGRALVARAGSARRAVVLGASFIGLEVAASLRARNIEVDVVGLEKIPMERILGPEIGQLVRKVHEDHGVIFHLGTTLEHIDEHSVTLRDGTVLPAELVVVGIGVKPSLQLAEHLGLAIDRGVLVDEYLETSVPGIFAAGDITRWPDLFGKDCIRVEHFVVAERQGQTAAHNILGHKEIFDDIPFFWTEQYDLGIAYVGHAEKWDRVEIDGSLTARDCSVAYFQDQTKLATANISRDLAGLRQELEFEKAAAKQRGLDGLKSSCIWSDARSSYRG